MLTTLPRPVASYIQAANDHDSAALAATFTADGIVADEGQEHRGRSVIQAWNARNVREYAMSMEVVGSEQQTELTIVTARVSGTFDGSPLLFRFHFTCDGNQIARLYIEHVG